MAVKYIGLILLVGISLYTDIKSFKIKNKAVAAAIVFGILINTALEGTSGLRSSFSGMVIPLAVFWIFFVLRMLGAGDIKLYCAIGSIMGSNYILNNMIYSILCGGVISITLMLSRGIFLQRLKYMWNYFYSTLLTRRAAAYTDLSNRADRAKFRFSYAIASGVLVQGIAKCFYGSYFF